MTTEPTQYGLSRTAGEYERLRAQAASWEEASARLLDRIGLTDGASCLDVGCGPGETMRLMAERVGPQATVIGLDSDPQIGRAAQQMLHRLGHTGCRVRAHLVGADEALPGGPYDLVFARLLLFHLPQRVEVLTRLWEAVAPGGHLLVQDYDMSVVGGASHLPAGAALGDLLTTAFTGLGCDVRVGTRLPSLFAQAGIGAPDGTDVAGHLAALGPARAMFEQVVRAVLPAAVARGVVDAEHAETVLRDLAEQAERTPQDPVLTPLLIGAWKQRPVD